MRYDWEKDNWVDFLRKTEGKEIVIWGSKDTAAAIVPILERIRKIVAVVDSDPGKRGQMFFGHKINLPENVVGWERYAVLICSMYLTDISTKLDMLGADEYYSGFFMLRRDLENEKMTLVPSDDVANRLKEVLSDEESRQLVDDILEKRKTGNIDYSDLISKPEYLRSDLFSFGRDEIYVDAGAFDGDSVLDFINKVGSFKKIYAYEANSSNYKKMQMKLGLAISVYGKDSLDLINAAVGKEEGVIRISRYGNESATAVLLREEESLLEDVRCIALDNMIKEVTYIKMDIEGCEADAIEGAKNLLRSCRPKLAICIYHKPADLWELPLLIHEMVPEYRLYIRHHGNIYYDTVLYATI